MNNYFLLIMSALLILASCKSDNSVKQQFQANPLTLEVLSPTDNQVFEAEAPVKLELLTDLVFDENSTSENKGYAKISLDNNTIILSQKTYEFTNLKPGIHTLLVELFHVTNVSYDITKGISFRVKPRDAVVNIVSPKNNYATNKTSVDLKLSLENLDLKTEGYLVATLNNNESILNGLNHKFTDLKPGSYTLNVEPYRNDRSSAGPEKSVSFKIEAIPPEGLDFSVWWPRDDSHVKGDLTALSLKISDKFIFSRENSSNKPNEGHFHIFVNDEKKPIEAYKSITTLKNLKIGDNTIIIEMVQNDHSTYNLKKTTKFKAQTVTSKN